NDTYIIRNYEGGNSILLQSTPGDYIGAGQTLSMFPQPGEIHSIDLGDRNHDGLIDTVHLFYSAGHFWDLSFLAPVGQNLLPGTFADAQDAYWGASDHPGINVSGDGRGGLGFGNFTVNDFTVDYSGFAPVLDHLSISFEQHSGSVTAPPLFGTL